LLKVKICYKIPIVLLSLIFCARYINIYVQANVYKEESYRMSEINERRLPIQLRQQNVEAENTNTAAEMPANSVFDEKTPPKQDYLTGENAVDGEIKDFEQGARGDCYLLAGLASLSHSEQGRKAIKDAVSVDEKTGNVTIEFKGINKSYTITPEEMKAARESKVMTEYQDGQKRLAPEYAKGDNDLLAFELAAKKFREDYKKNGGKEFKDLPKMFKPIQFVKNFVPKNSEYGNILDAGFLGETTFLLTGKKEETSMTTWGRKADVKKFQQDPERYAMTFMAPTERTFDKDSLKDSSVIKSWHVYAVKEVNDEYVMAVNPFNTEWKYKLPRKEFEKSTLLMTGITDLGAPEKK